MVNYTSNANHILISHVFLYCSFFWLSQIKFCPSLVTRVQIFFHESKTEHCLFSVKETILTELDTRQTLQVWSQWSREKLTFDPWSKSRLLFPWHPKVFVSNLLGKGKGTKEHSSTNAGQVWPQKNQLKKKHSWSKRNKKSKENLPVDENSKELIQNAAVSHKKLRNPKKNVRKKILFLYFAGHCCRVLKGAR